MRTGKKVQSSGVGMNNITGGYPPYPDSMIKQQQR